ncbi:hypothetical protein [Flavobacterium sp. UBA7682]|uniref:hypothetical protein n=1 Tax=Flavobacterium sp. UBA7682 TaxID=1946560 RepID=UPI0025B8A877|nr:hypothetical protein [Flavobacterium sp. UBA7682]
MIRANSLLYAVYVCLIVAIICSALLYFANLYNMLNLFYNTYEELYVQNDSALHYFLSKGDQDADVLESESGLVSNCEMKTHGLLKIAIVKSSLNADTISSAHFVGQYAKNPIAIYLSNFSNSLSYSGTVKLIGDKMLPFKFIEDKYINNVKNILVSTGNVNFSKNQLPEVSSDYKKGFNITKSKSIAFKDIERTETGVYFNSFMNQTLEIKVDYGEIGTKVIKGNFIVTAKDSVLIDENAVLEDVVVKAPVIRIRRGFKGAIQVFASKKIIIENDVVLSYPSVVSIYNDTNEKSEIYLGENSKVYGAIVLFGNSLNKIDLNKIELSENTLLIGDLYCTGKVMISGSVYGSVYTNRFYSKTKSATYENCIINTEIDISKRPDYFISIPLFKEKSESLGTIKKIL